MRYSIRMEPTRASATVIRRRAAVGLLSAGVVALVGGGVGAAADPIRMYALGDSWAAGLHADPSRTFVRVAAAKLNWIVRVDAVSGTGYLTATSKGRPYPDRAAHVPAEVIADVVLIQGGSNDQGRSSDALAAAAGVTVARLLRRFPRATVVLLGPGPDPEPVTVAQRAVDTTLQDAAARVGVRYISMLQADWIPAGSADRVLSPVNHHPTVAGHAYLGARLASALREIPVP